MNKSFESERQWLLQSIRRRVKKPLVVALGGSQATGEALENSDFDTMVWGEKLRYPGSLTLYTPAQNKVDLILGDKPSLAYSFNEEAESGRGTMLQIASHCIILFEAEPGLGASFQAAAMALYKQGPRPITQESLIDRLETVRDSASEIAAMREGPARHLAAQLLASRLGYTAQRASRVWSAKKGKMLARRLGQTMPAFKLSLEQAAARLAKGDASAMRACTEGVMEMYAIALGMPRVALSTSVDQPAQPATRGDLFYYARRSPTATLDYLQSDCAKTNLGAREWLHWKYSNARAAVTLDRMKRPHQEYRYAVTGLASVVMDTISYHQGIIPTERHIPEAIATMATALPGFVAATELAYRGKPDSLLQLGDLALRATCRITPESRPAARPGPAWARI